MRAAALILLANAACALAPGQHVSEAALEARGTADAKLEIHPITPTLLVALAETRVRGAAARTPDPLAEDAARYEYKVAPFDVLSVTVWDHPELTIPAGEFRAADVSGNAVQADGTMFYPHVGVVPVAGRTLPEIRVLLTERLRKYVESPQLDVRVAAFRGRRVQVAGEVVQPATIPIVDVPLRVQDAIAAGKGLGPNAWTKNVTLVRGGKAYRLDLQALYDDGDLSQNWLLQDGDVLNVPSREDNKVYVLGEVKQPSSKLMPRAGMSLADAIGDSQGLDPLTSNAGGVYVFRGRYEAPEVYRLDATSPDALLLASQFRLEPHDVVFVAPYALTTWNRVVSQILPTIQGIWQIADIGNRSVNFVQEAR